MYADFWIILQWWGTLFLVGAVAYPLTKKLFSSWPASTHGDDSTRGWFDHGYLFSKAVGMAVVSWIVFVLGTLRVMPFSVWSIGVGLGVVFVVGLWGNKGDRGQKGNWGKIILEELFFLAALLFWSWVKAHEPSIRGLEKFMDFGFMQSILNSQYFPPADMWYAGLPINYYYFGHMVTAVLTKLSGLDLAYTFNLMLATIFALTLTMSFSIGCQLMDNKQKAISGGLLTAFLVTMAGNLQTLYAFTRGYTGDNVKPFWEIGWEIGEFGGFREFWGKIGEGMNTYWYANATRFIPFTIHEFPGYSFVVSDVHGHVLSIPFVLLAIGLLIALFQGPALGGFKGRALLVLLVFYGFLVGVLLMTNALDGPIYFGLLAVVLFFTNSPFSPSYSKRGLGELLLVAVTAIITSLPFLIHFKSFVTGLAVNCPPAFLANTKIGPIIFEGVEKCQISPFWMWWLLWGFFVYCGSWLIYTNRTQKLLITFFLFALALVIFPEFFYFKDIYPAHFRSNTMFKLGYQAFILFSIVAGYTIVKLFRKKLFLLILLPQLFLVSIFPIFAVRSYFNGLKKYEGIYGFNWMMREYPDDYKAIQWLDNNSPQPPLKIRGGNGGVTSLALVEADGDSYTDYGRFSAFTGRPTIIGWPVHEWLWRGSYDVVAPRREEVGRIYESEDVEVTRTILTKYGVRYVVVGKLEREKYKNLQEWKFGQLGREIFRSGSTVVYSLSTPP